MPYNINFLKQPYTYDKENCAIATVELNGFSANRIVNVIEYTNDIHENSEFYLRSVELEPSYFNDDPESDISGYLITYYETNDNYYNNYLVTEKTNDNNKPLYYSYELKYDAYAITNEDVLQMYKNNETLVQSKHYKVEFGNSTINDNYYGDQDTDLDRYGSGIIWGDFDSLYDVHRVRVLLPIEFCNESDFYTVRYNKRLHAINNPNHIELVEKQDLYTQGSDFICSGNYILYESESTIPRGSVNKLYITKDPKCVISSKGIHSLQGKMYQNEVGTQWKMKLSTGKFIKNADHLEQNNDCFALQYVPEVGTDYNIYQPHTYVKPKVLGGNVLKVDEKPIYIDTSEYVYPDYDITMYSKTTDDSLLPTGEIAIDIDGKNTTEIKISSIDRAKGYMLLNKPVAASKEINLYFYTDVTDEYYIRNLELNPRLTGVYGFHPSSDNSFDNIGVAIRKLPSTGLPSGTDPQKEYYYPYFFDFDAITTDGSGVFYRGTPEIVPSGLTVNSYLTDNPYTSYANVSGEFLPIAHLSLNKLTPDILKITDARVINGGVTSEELKRLDNNQLNSFTDVGYYDGEPLPHSSLMIIHIPSGTFENLVQKWEDSNLYSPDMYTDITKEEIEALGSSTSGEYAEYYNKLLAGKSPTGDQLKDPFNAMQYKWAKKQASQYVDQLIKKYISAGTQYILLDEAFNEIGLDRNV
jgi:hypothetical protein